MNYTKKCKHKKQIKTIKYIAFNALFEKKTRVNSFKGYVQSVPFLSALKVVILIVMLTIPSIDLVEVDVAITIEDEVFDKDLENKSSLRYKKLEEQVEQEVRKWE